MTHYGAGILPVTWHGTTLLFLVGKDVRDGLWSDFGGKCERADKNDPVETAVREFYEETCGVVLSDVKGLKSLVQRGPVLTLKCRTQNNYPYTMYVVELPFVPHVRNAFQKVAAFLRHHNMHKSLLEKTDVQWVTWSHLTSPAFPKRHVFETSITQHHALLAALANPNTNNHSSTLSTVSPTR